MNKIKICLKLLWVYMYTQVTGTCFERPSKWETARHVILKSYKKVRAPQPFSSLKGLLILPGLKFIWGPTNRKQPCPSSHNFLSHILWWLLIHKVRVAKMNQVKTITPSRFQRWEEAGSAVALCLSVSVSSSSVKAVGLEVCTRSATKTMQAMCYFSQYYHGLQMRTSTEQPYKRNVCLCGHPQYHRTGEMSDIHRTAQEKWLPMQTST